MLSVEALTTGYGKLEVLHAVSMRVQPGEIVAVIGANGSGKSTLLRTVCGLLPVWSGGVLFKGTVINELSPSKRVRLGMSFALQGDRVFEDLTVLENLRIGGWNVRSPELASRFGHSLRLFPALEQRLNTRAGLLSGGERQMLSIGRALLPEPELLVLDEPSLGLSPDKVKDVLQTLSHLSEGAGLAILVVEQKVREVLRIADRVYGMRLGRVAVEGTPHEIFSSDRLSDLFLS